MVDLLPRAAFNFDENAPNGVADYTLTTTITAPAPGILLLSGGIDAFSNSGDDSYRCVLRIDDAQVDGTFMGSRVDGLAGVNQSEDCTASGAVVVDAGTYKIDFDVSSLAATTGLGDASVWALWVPLDGSGAIPTP